MWVEAAATSSLFAAYDQTGNVDITSGFTALPWLTEIHKDAGVFTHAANSPIVTINYTGLVRVTTDVGAQASNNSRTTSVFRLVLDPATGTFAEVAGSRANLYTRNSASNGSASITRILQVAPNYRLQVEGVRSAGGATITTEANTCRLTIETIKQT